MNCLNEFENASLALLSHFPFYGSLLAGCKVNFTQKMPTAYVTICATGDIELGINPDFFLSLTAPHRVGLLLHELNHLMLKHLHRTKSLGYDPHLANIAADIELNQFIPETLLPEQALLPVHFKLPEGLDYETYYALLSKLRDKQQKENKGAKGVRGEQGGQKEQSVADAKTLDEHTTGEKDEKVSDNSVSDGSVSEEMQSPEAEANVIRDAIDKAQKKAGSIPQHIEKMLQELNKKSKTPWQVLLRKFVGRNTSPSLEGTRTRANRRVGLMAEGYKAKFDSKIMIGVDQSGSVSDEALAQFVSEMQKIVKETSDKVTIAFFDTEVSNVVRITDANKVPKKRVRSGGTDFNAIVAYAKKERPDLLIILTDGEAPNPDKVERLPLLWAIINQAELETFSELRGQKIKIEMQK